MSSLDTGQNLGLHMGDKVKVHQKDLINQASTSVPSQKRQILQSDSGISLSSLSQDSISMSSPKQTEAAHEDIVSPNTGPSHLLSTASGSVNPQDLTQNAHQNSASPRSAAKHPHIVNCPGESRNLKRGKSSGSLHPGSVTCQTRYFVLQFLHQSMNEESLLHLSQSSFSTTSESEPRFISHAERLRQQWQDNCQSSSSATHSGHLKSKPRSKLRATKSAYELKGVNCFKDISQQNKPAGNRRVVSAKTAEVTKYKKSPKLSKQSAVQATDQRHLVRSISENTEGSEHGTYLSDADDELDGSFDSSQQGSVTSRCFKEQLAHFHQQQHSKKVSPVKNPAEPVASDSPNFAVEESVSHAADDESASSVLSLDMISIEQQPMSPTTRHARVSDYLLQMSQMSVESCHLGDSGLIDLTDLDLKYLDDAAEEIHGPQTGSDSEQLLPFDVDLEEDGVMSRESDQETSDDQAKDVQVACGGVSVDETNQIGGGNGRSFRADCSHLRLDMSDHQDTALLIDAVHSLQQDIEEEMFSLESEFEEALQSVHSDHWHTRLPNLNRRNSLSPEAAEAVRILARIGDEVQQRHFQDLDRAVSKLLITNCAGFFTYENFCEAAPKSLGGDMDQWKQIATLLLYSQHVALHLSHCGRQGLNRIVDYTVRMLADTAADFIIKQGGWAEMFEQGSTTPSSPDHPGPVLSPFLGPFTTATTTSTTTTAATITTTSKTSSQPPGTIDDHSTPPSAKAEQSQKLGESISDSEDLGIIGGASETDLRVMRGTTETRLNRNATELFAEGVEEAILPALEALPLASPNHRNASEKLRKKTQQEREEKQAPQTGDLTSRGEGVISEMFSIMVNSGLLTRCVVSVGVLAVSAAIAFRFVRSC